MVLARRALLVTLLASCGRLGFGGRDEGSTGDGGTGPGRDAPASCATAVAYDAVGDGSVSAPYLICTAAQWIDITAHPAGWTAHFMLAADIDLSTIAPPHPTIGSFATLVPFSGVMDGDRHVIRNFINGTSRDHFGLFGYVSGPQAEIKNIALVDAQLWTSEEGGGLVGFLEQGTVSNAGILGPNCYVRTMAYANHHGTLIGETRAGSSVVDVFGSCTSDGDGGGVGGLIGHHEGSVANCYFTQPGVITNAGGNYVGGLVGWNNGGSVSNCFAITDVHGNNPGTVSLLVGAGTIPINSYYSSTRTCTNDGGPCYVNGTAVDLGSIPDYFFHKTNPPLSSWDFSTVWTERAGAEPILAWMSSL